MSETNTNTDTWFLQGDEGMVYGPVDTATLKDWCLEGRIEPDNALSNDSEHWFEAADVPELEMDWLALLDDDTRCGPFNLQLVPGLVENGVIPADAVLENRHTGQKRPAVESDNADDEFPDPEPHTEETLEEREAPVEPSAVDDAVIPEEAPTRLQDVSEPQEPDEAPSTAGVSDETNQPDRSAGPLDAISAENELPLSKRLEPLQRSASEAREQLIETRQTFQTLRTAHTVLEDEYQRLKSELSASLEAQQKGEQQLIEQQDRAAAAETEVENLTAQLEQIKDHYDRLQLENQNQFEKIDDLQSTQLHNEQRFQRELTEWQDRADAKTDLLASSVKLLMRDEDLATRLPSISSLTTEDSNTKDELTTTIKKLEQQLEQERQQAQRSPREPGEGRGRNPFATLVLFATGVLLGAVLIGLSLRGCKATPDNTTQIPSYAPDAKPAEPATEEPRDFPLETAGTLDLQPEANPQHQAPPDPPQAIVSSIRWPALSLPSSTMEQGEDSLRIVFNEGLFSVATRLTPDAIAALNTLAEQLQGKLSGYQLMIEGHTDATPIAAAGSRYVDNFALGMARAEAVKTFLAQTGKVPANAIRTSSAGESSPPFSNETEADRKRNRTAVLTLVKKK